MSGDDVAAQVYAECWAVAGHVDLDGSWKVREMWGST